MCGFTRIELRFALRLYVLDAFEAKTSVLCLKQQQEQRHHLGMEAYCGDELSVMVENAYLDLTDSDAAVLLEASCPAEQEAILRAQNFLGEHKLRDWIVLQNVSKGLAPLSSSAGLRWDCIQEVSTEIHSVSFEGTCSRVEIGCGSVDSGIVGACVLGKSQQGIS